MIKLNTIKLSGLEKERLSDQSMRMLRGGKSCTCGCHYVDAGGSSAVDNDVANYDGGLTSYGGGSASCGCGSANNGHAESAFWRGY